MGPRLALVFGIGAGVIAAIVLGVMVVGLAGGATATVTLPPGPSVASPSPVAPVATPAPTPAPTGTPVSPPPSPSPSPTASASTDPSASADPSASVDPSASAQAAATPYETTSTNALFGIGNPAPPLSVDRLGGGTIDLASLRGHPVWVVFTGTYCPPCRDEYPLLESFATRYADDGLVVVAVHEKDDPAAVAALTTELGVTFPVGLDPDAAAGRDWKAIALPIHFFVDRDGIVRAGALGGVGPDVMAQSLSAILPGVEVTP